jgi:hypothetical protein
MACLRGTPAGDVLESLGFVPNSPVDQEKSRFASPVPSQSAQHVEKSSDPTNAQANDLEGQSTASTPTRDASAEDPQAGPDTPKRAPIIVSWHDDKDMDNPRMWSRKKKLWVMLILVLYSFVVYGASSIVLPGLEITMQRYGVSVDVAYLTLSVSWSSVPQPR